MLGLSYDDEVLHGPVAPAMVPPADLIDAMERTAPQAVIDRCRTAGYEVIR